MLPEVYACSLYIKVIIASDWAVNLQIPYVYKLIIIIDVNLIG